jgi:hypothetical protein
MLTLESLTWKVDKNPNKHIELVENVENDTCYT